MTKTKPRLSISQSCCAGRRDRYGRRVFLIPGLHRRQTIRTGKATSPRSFTRSIRFPRRAGLRLKISTAPVHITGWDRREVKVDAVKSAWSKGAARRSEDRGRRRARTRFPFARNIRTTTTPSISVTMTSITTRPAWNIRSPCRGRRGSTRSNWSMDGSMFRM